MECEAGETGKLTGVDRVYPRGECAAESVRKYLAEVADMPGRVQLGEAGQDILQACAVVIVQGRGVSGEPAGHLSHRRGPGRGIGLRARRVAMWARTI